MHALHVNAKKIVLNFDEYIDLKDIRNNLIVSPVPKIMPTVTSHLKAITIHNEGYPSAEYNICIEFRKGRSGCE